MHCPVLLPEAGPSTPSKLMVMRVAQEEYSWKEGECIVFDESCEHEVYIGPSVSSDRIILILDFVNPLMANPSDYLSRVSPSAILAPTPPRGERTGKWTREVFLRRYEDVRHHLANGTHPSMGLASAPKRREL